MVTYAIEDVKYRWRFIMNYEVIIFDADETLFDFKKSERYALKNTMIEFGIDYDENYHLKVYKDINDDRIAVIEKLHKNHRLIIITNGLKDVQDNRIRKSVIGGYFDDIVVSDEIEVSKPDPRIFEHTLKNINHTDKTKVLMVGDSLTSDIQGGINFGIDTCWFNSNKIINKSAINPTYEISNLMELKSIVEK